MSNLFKNFDIFLAEDDYAIPNGNNSSVNNNDSLISRDHIKKQIISQAESEADKIVEAARKKAKRVVERAEIKRKEIFDNEKKLGYKEGMIQADEKINETKKECVMRFEGIAEGVLEGEKEIYSRI